MWTIERLIKAGLIKEKEDPTANGIHYHDTVWTPNDCTLNVYQDGYHEFVHYIYKEVDGNIKFATSRSNECVVNDSTFFAPVMTDRRIDASLLLTSLMNSEVLEDFLGDDGDNKTKLFEARYWCVPVLLVAAGLIFGLIKLYSIN